MYERNAIVIDRFFANLFGYEDKSNLKDNYKNYCDLVLKLEEYQNISREEDNIMIEFEKVARQVKDNQKEQELLYKRNLKLQETRHSLFEDLEESKEILLKKFAKIEEEINKNNLDIKNNSEQFAEEIGEFHQKSDDRNKCGRERRIIEDDYQKILKKTIEDFSNIDQEKIEYAGQFLKRDGIEELKRVMKEKILKNGEKEKIPFDTEVIEKSIDLSIDLENEKIKLLILSYERTSKLIKEIKNDAIKIDRHKRYVKDTKSKFQFLNVVNDYLVLFLDNERMNVVGGEKEHKKLMEEACQNLEKDLEQIQKLYDLLEKEITNKATKKMYKEQYYPNYLIDLLEDEKQFEKSVSKLNVVGTILYPNYWRVEGMQKVYDVFKDIITNVYEKDLSEYEPLNLVDENTNMKEEKDTEKLAKDDFDWGDLDQYYGKAVFDEEDAEEDEEDYEEEELDEIDEETEEDGEEAEEEDEEEDDEDEEDRVIDEILGFYNTSSKNNEDSEEEDDNEVEEDDEDEDFELDWDEDEEEEQNAKKK